MVLRRSHLAALILVVAWSLIAAGPALGHAELARSEPMANASLAAAPESLRLTFTEPVDRERVVVDVVDSNQLPVDGLGTPSLDAAGTGVEVDLPDLEPGVYVVRYQVLSTVDGHVTAGSFAFQVDPSGAQPPPSVASTSESPSADLSTALARWVALASALALVGLLLFWRFSGRPALRPESIARMSRTMWRAFAVAASLCFAALATFLTLAARPLLGPHLGAHDGFVLDFAAPFGWSQFAIAMRLALVATLLAAVTAFVRSTRLLAERSPGPGESGWTAALFLFGGLTLLGFSLAGHVASLGGPIFAILDLGHLLAVAAWVGTLPGVLLIHLAHDRRRRAGEPPALPDVIRRHARMAMVAAPVVALTGIANSPLVLGSARNLVASAWGNLLLAKVLLFGAALGIGAVNSQLVRRRTLRRLPWLVTAELGLGALAVMAAAGLLTVPAGASRAPQLSTPTLATAHFYEETAAGAVQITVAAPAPGPQTYQLALLESPEAEPDGGLQKVFFVFTPPRASGLAEQRVELSRVATPLTPLYETTGNLTPVVGEWELGVILRRAGERDEQLSLPLSVRELGPPELLPPADTGVGVPSALATAWRIVPPPPNEWAVPLALLVVAAIAFGLQPRTGEAAPAWRRALPAIRTGAVVLCVGTGLIVGSRVLVTAANAAPEPQARQVNPIAADTRSVERGRTLYLANCAVCHGAEGRGGGPAAGDLTTQAADLRAHVPLHTDGELYAWMSSGIAGTPMPGFADVLARDERWDLVNYLRDQFGSQP